MNLLTICFLKFFFFIGNSPTTQTATTRRNHAQSGSVLNGRTRSGIKGQDDMEFIVMCLHLPYSSNHLIYPFNARVVGAPQMILQPVSLPHLTNNGHTTTNKAVVISILPLHNPPPFPSLRYRLTRNTSVIRWMRKLLQGCTSPIPRFCTSPPTPSPLSPEWTLLGAKVTCAEHNRRTPLLCQCSVTHRLCQVSQPARAST